MMNDLFEVTRAYSNTKMMIPKTSIVSIAEVHDNNEISTCLTVEKLYMYLDNREYQDNEYVVEQLNITDSYHAIKLRLGMHDATKE